MSSNEPTTKPDQAQSKPERQRSKKVATYLAIFLGSLGAQYFYLGAWGTGTLLLLISLTGCWFGSPLGIEIVGIVDFVLLSHMTFDDFDARFNNSVPRAFEIVWKPKMRGQE